MKKNSSNKNIYDLIGVGIGPFNLSLAALANPISSLNTLFFEQKEKFDWHSGLLLEDCDLQVPFLADLVTMADPSSKFSYLNYLHNQGRLYNFYFYENFKIPRVEYNSYCQWVCQNLENLNFGFCVTEIDYVDELFQVKVLNLKNKKYQTFFAKNVVLGIGTKPYWPNALGSNNAVGNITHSSDYLNKKPSLQKNKNITIVGNGQSAAEIFLDLLRDHHKYNYFISWVSRSVGFFPMEHSKLGLEHFSPDYIQHFYSLAEQSKNLIRAKQNFWYKGISDETISAIYDALYRKSINNKPLPVFLLSNTELQNVNTKNKNLILDFLHLESMEKFQLKSTALICATGYQPSDPAFLNPIKPMIQVDFSERMKINSDYSLDIPKIKNGKVFVQNAEIHTHGICAPDLGLGAYRAAVIVNKLLNKQHYQVRAKNVFQSFGISNLPTSNLSFGKSTRGLA